ncbi:BTB domain-containing protein [Mycena chlorophos]|uniref:BTB domain-containing protein n=1 Tax=Mycena chlorophos TaxID=658473 RepID=A0A8H6SEU1_MYCCL|nr:BTB domain-containing protein [Mycena chlorophos]
MSSNEPLTKRRREEDAAPDDVTRSSEYFFDDGNIILQVESTQFRLHKTVLAMHSTVFRDMFTVPLPADEPLVDNCAVVVLSGDSPEDWNHLLSAMYPIRSTHEKQTVEFVCALLRLSTKYDIPEFRRQWLARLHEELPTTLAEYDSGAGWKYIVVAGDNSHCVLASLIDLAREIGIHSILPLTLYSLVWDDVLVAPATGTNKLNLSDQAAYLRGQLRLLRLSSTTTMRWLEPEEPLVPCATCSSESRPDCSRVVEDFRKRCTSEISAGVFASWTELAVDGLCDACEEAARTVYEEGRVECWKQLPSIFDLPDWEELKRLDLD